jgi:osmotically-inducible protein OsmY
MSRRGTAKDSRMITTVRHAPHRKLASDHDRQLQAAAAEALLGSSYVALRQLDCRVSGGVVEISGTVSSFYLKQLAQAAMQRVQPSGSVRNLIEVLDKSPRG